MESPTPTSPQSLLTPSFRHASRLKLKLKEYHEKYPRIRKSLIFSKSADFTEYESLLLEASPLCAPDRIYLIRSPDPGDNFYCGQFTISSCKANCRAAFKIKSSSSRVHYAVSPHRGFLAPGEEVRIIVQVSRRTKHGDSAENKEKDIFRNAVLGVFSAVVDSSLENLEIASFWDHFEENSPHLMGAHFVKKFFIVEDNGDIDFGRNCVHNIFKAFSPSQSPPSSPQEAASPAVEKSSDHRKNAKLVKLRRRGGEPPTEDDENLRYLHVYNCMLLEKLVSQSKSFEYTLLFLFIFLFLLLFIILILLRGFRFI